MAVCKVVYNKKTLIDLTCDTVTADKVLAGYTAHLADGTRVTGTLLGNSSSEYVEEDAMTDSNGEAVTDSDGDGLAGRTVYRYVKL